MSGSSAGGGAVNGNNGAGNGNGNFAYRTSKERMNRFTCYGKNFSAKGVSRII